MAKPGLSFAGFLYDDSGDAVNGATVNLYAKNGVSTSLANTTTNSSGYWSISHTPASGEAGEYDVQITSGASKRRFKFDDAVQLASLDAETLSVRGNEGAVAASYMFADEGEDAGDRWRFQVADGGVLTFDNDINTQGTYVAHVTVTPNSTVASSTVAIAGNVTVGNALTVTGTTTLNGNLVLGDAAADTLTVGATLQGASPLTFEGGTADGYETTFAITDPTADRTITFPNLSGTVQLSGNPITGTTIDASTDFTIGDTVITDGVVTDSTGLQLAANLDINGTVDISGDLTLSAGGDGALVFATAGENSIKIPDNQASALIIEEANNAYMTFVTTDSSEAVSIAKTLTLSTVAAAGTDTDKFLVLDSSGNVDYRTGTQVLSDIGGGTGGGDMSSFQLEDDDGTEVTISDAKEVKIIGSGVTTNWTDTDNGTDGDPYDLTITVDAAQTGITSVYNTSLKMGRDSQNLIDFATTDNKIILRVNNVDEVELVENALSPVTNDGVGLGTTSLGWSDLHIAAQGVINWANGEMTITEGDANTLTVAGGTFATAALTSSTGVFSGILKTDDATEATSTTDGSLQTDGGLSVVKDAVFGDDVKLLSDSSVLAFGADGDVTVTHDADKGLELNDSTFLGFASAAGTPATDDKVQGIVVEFLAAEAITAFDAVYVSTTTGRVGRADANDAAKLPAIGIAIEAQGSAGSSVRVLTHGVYRDDGGFGGNMTVGADLYVSETPGTLTTTAPGDDGDFVQLMGVAVGVRSAFINPDLTIIEVA